MMQPMTIEGLLAPRLAQPNVQVPINMPATAETQQPVGGGVWGQGGRLITPEQAQQQRARAQQLMGIDYSPIGSPWQGLARVLGNVQGALQERGVRKAEERTAAYNQELMDQIRSGMSGGADGSSPTSAPNIEALLLNKYASPEIKAYAQRVQEQQQWERRKQMEWENREVPEIIQLQRLADDPNQPDSIRASASKAVEAKVNPMITALLPEGGFYHGPTGGLPTALGGSSQATQQSGAPQVGAVVDGFRFKGGDPRDRNNWSPVGSSSGAAAQGVTPMASAEASKTISRSQLSPILSTYGRSGTDAWLKNYGIKVVD